MITEIKTVCENKFIDIDTEVNNLLAQGWIKQEPMQKIFIILKVKLN